MNQKGLEFEDVDRIHLFLDNVKLGAPAIFGFDLRLGMSWAAEYMMIFEKLYLFIDKYFVDKYNISAKCRNERP
jgi:hypothetical protein